LRLSLRKLISNRSNEMNPKKLKDTDKTLKNVFEIPVPYGWAVKRMIQEPDKDKRKIIFFGNDLDGIIDLGVDKEKYIARVNQCLNFLRKHYAGYQLYLKPHPASMNEADFLDLKGFTIIDDKTTSEIFLWKNWGQIHSVFAVNSWSTFGAYSMGLNAHLFYRYFADIFGGKFFEQMEDMFFRMPASFFIGDLNDRPLDNAPVLKADDLLEGDLKKILNNNKGTVWLNISATEYVVLMVALAKLIKKTDPSRKVALIVSRHRRWNIINLDDIRDHFDEIVIMPRVYYTLRPRRLLTAIRTSWKIRRFPIAPQDIFISASQVEFVENCFVSYHKKNIRIGLVMNRDFHTHYSQDSLAYIRNDDFRFSKGSWFFNRIFEPILGLNRSVFMYYEQGEGIYITRYQKPINTVFDRVYLLNNVL